MKRINSWLVVLGLAAIVPVPSAMAAGAPRIAVTDAATAIYGR